MNEDIRKVIRINPLKSVNGIEFGSSRKKVWEILGRPYSTFKKDVSDKVDTDDYKYFHIFYDDDYNFEAIEIFDEADIYYDEKKVSKTYSEALEYFKELFDDIEEDDYGFTTEKGSIGVYIENDDDIIDSILFGKKNYYNEI